MYEQTMALVECLPNDTHIETIEGKCHTISLGGQKFAVGEFFHPFYDNHASHVYARLGVAINPNYR